MKNVTLDLYADPVGDLYVEWTIPIELISEKVITVGLPTYKYEMSYFFGIPVPFSSLAETLESEVFEITIPNSNSKVDYSLKKEFKGDTFLIISLSDEQFSSKDHLLTIKFIVKKLVTKDKVFFNFVYTLTSPLKTEVTADITVKAKFSYHISSYKLKTVQIDNSTGRIMHDTGLIQHNRIGDYIHGYGDDVTLSPGGILDLHVHGSRLPFMIDRRIFWIVVFLWILLSISGIIGIVSFLINSI